MQLIHSDTRAGTPFFLTPCQVLYYLRKATSGSGNNNLEKGTPTEKVFSNYLEKRKGKRIETDSLSFQMYQI